MKVSGIVHLIEETKTFGAKGFKKRVLVLEQNNGRWSNFIPVDLTGDNCESADDMQVGDEVEVDGNLTGRKWQKDPSSDVKFFLSFEARSVSIVSSAGPQPNEESSGEPIAAAAAYDDDIPF